MARAAAVAWLAGAAMLGALGGSGRAAAQGRGGGGFTPPAPPSAADVSLAGDLVRQARAAVYATPAWLAPRQLADVARDEMRRDPDQGLADFRQAFHLARSLRPPAGDDDLTGQGREQVKETVELAAVGEFALRGDADQARELARLADVPKAPLYDRLIESAFNGGGRGGRAWRPQVLRDDSQPDDPGAADEDESASDRRQRAMDEVLSLVAECKRTDGTYPYRGVAMTLRRLSGDPLNRILLVRDAYQSAAAETDPASIASASLLLRAGHQAEPALDAALASTLSTLLTRLAQQPAGGTDAAAARRASSLLMGLFTTVAPAQAQAMIALFPDMAPAQGITTLAGSGTPGAPGGRAGRQGQSSPTFSMRSGGAGAVTLAGAPAFSFTVNAYAPAPMDAQAATDAQSFLRLLAQAEQNLRHSPSDSLAYANQAAGLLNDTLIQTEAVAATRLALVYYQLSDAADGARVLDLSLAEADREGVAADAQVAAADPTQLAQWMRGSLPNQATVSAVYSLAARLDFPTAAQRASTAPFTLLKPAVLARVALVAEAGAARGPFSGRPGGG